MDTDKAQGRLKAEQQRLEELRRKLDETRVRAQPDQELRGELSSYDQHPADAGSETFEREKVLAQIEQVEAQLADVGRAFRRLDEGTYGTCEVCGQAIPDERLEERPATRLCVDHQREMERVVHPPAAGV